MKVGLYLDVRNPEHWHRPWRDVYAQALELCVEGERLGADSVWVSEHHFFDDGYISQPLTFAAAVAARTTRVRIGTAIYIAGLRPAAHILEEAAIRHEAHPALAPTTIAAEVTGTSVMPNPTPAN